MAQISYTNKVALNENPEILDINKVTDDDMNEIKQVVNDNYNNTIQITDTEPTDTDNKIWIDTGEVGSAASEITNEYSTSTGLGYSADYVNRNISGTILWTNPHSGTTIDGNSKTIQIDLSNYDSYEIIYIDFATNTTDDYTLCSTGIIPKTRKTILTSPTLRFLGYRKITAISDSSISWGNYGFYGTYGSSTLSNNNTYCVVQYIIGYKTGLFN